MSSDADTKMIFEKNLRLLTYEHFVTRRILGFMLENVESMALEFKHTSEPLGLQRHIVNMARCSFHFSNQLQGAISLYDDFLLNIKKKAPIEQYFCRSDDEDDDFDHKESQSLGQDEDLTLQSNSASVKPGDSVEESQTADDGEAKCEPLVFCEQDEQPPKHQRHLRAKKIHKSRLRTKRPANN